MTTPSPSPSPPPPPLALTRVCTVLRVLRFLRFDSLDDILKTAHISDTFRDALECYSATVWRRIASSLDSPSLTAFFEQNAFAWAAHNLFTVGQLDVSRLEDHPIFVATAHGAADVVRVCIAADPSCVNVRDGWEWPALHIASLRGHTECARELLAAGGDITVVTNGFTSLHLAAQEGHVDVVRLVVAHPDFEKVREQRNSKGDTAMDVATTRAIKQLL